MISRKRLGQTQLLLQWNIGSGTWGIEWSHAWWHHVTLKGQGREPNIFNWGHFLLLCSYQTVYGDLCSFPSPYSCHSTLPFPPRLALKPHWSLVYIPTSAHRILVEVERSKREYQDVPTACRTDDWWRWNSTRRESARMTFVSFRHWESTLAGRLRPVFRRLAYTTSSGNHWQLNYRHAYSSPSLNLTGPI